MQTIKIICNDIVYLTKFDVVYYEEENLCIQMNGYKTTSIKISYYDAEKYIETLQKSNTVTIITDNIEWLDE